MNLQSCGKGLKCTHPLTNKRSIDEASFLAFNLVSRLLLQDGLCSCDGATERCPVLQWANQGDHRLRCAAGSWAEMLSFEVCSTILIWLLLPQCFKSPTLSFCTWLRTSFVWYHRPPPADRKIGWRKDGSLRDLFILKNAALKDGLCQS